MSDTSEHEQHTQQLLARLHAAVTRYSEQADTETQVGALIREFRQALGLKPTAFARRLQVAPQTLNRWEKNQSRPRRSQLHKFSSLMMEESPASLLSPTTESAAMECLGIRLSGSMSDLLRQAKAIWVFKAGYISRNEREILDELLIEVLRSGGDVHYVFFQHSATTQLFRQRCKAWLVNAPLSGTVTGYCIKDFRFAYRLGLAAVTSTWMVIEYWPQQAARLRRRLDVFALLQVREYSDAARATVKSEDGQPCWLELATPQDRTWIKKLSWLRSKATSDAAVDVIRLASRCD